MSMGGAFGALGGDLSTLSQNPAGIGVYRSNEIGFTLDLDAQHSLSNSQGFETKWNQTKFLVNNIGAVLTMKLPSKTVPNLNFGFTYNKAVSFNRQYAGSVPRLTSSLSNYIAGVANEHNLVPADVTTSGGFDPYYPTDGGYAAPWITILGYDGYLIDPTGSGSDIRWDGQWGEGTSGSGTFAVRESGSVDEYNIAIGGNISNILYWGMNFDITNMNYTLHSQWAEDLKGAYVPDNAGNLNIQDAYWNLGNYYHVNGTGFNYQIGVILKPIQELRIGLALHTPTWYSLTESYSADLDYDYSNTQRGMATTNQGELAYNDVSFKSPMKFIGSIAGVIANRLILSADYEWTGYNKMKYSEPGKYNWGGGFGWDDPWFGAPTKAVDFKNDSFADTNDDIRYYYQNTNTLRLGAEFRVTPRLSVRAGYSFVSSPVKEATRNDKEYVYTSGTLPNYRFDNTTNYITCGIGYRWSNLYVDMAYVYKHMDSSYHAYTPDIVDRRVVSPSPQAKLTLDNSQVVLSAGIKF